MKYSIITINYNNCDGLRRTIESVVNQTCQDFEYIVIDGGSTDGSVEVIKEYADQIDYWVSESDKGIYNAMNKGILQAHGEYLNFMNSGDCFYDKDVLRHIQKDCTEDFFIGMIVNVGEHNEIISYNVKAKQMTMFHFFLSTLPHQGCFIKRKMFDKYGMYDENLNIVADWKFFMDCIVGKNCTYIHSDILIAKCEYRGASNDYTKLIEEKRKTLCEVLLPGVYKDYERLSMLGISAYDDVIYISNFQALRVVFSRLVKIMVFVHKKISHLLTLLGSKLNSSLYQTF